MIDSISEILYRSYTKKELVTSLLKETFAFYRANSSLLKEKNVPKELIEKAKEGKQFTKDIAVEIVAYIFCDQDLYLNFREGLNVEIRALLDYLVWEGFATVKEIKQKLGFDILEMISPKWSDHYKIYALKSNFYFFPHVIVSEYSDYKIEESYLFLPKKLRILLSSYYEESSKYHAVIYGSKTPPKSEYTFEGDVDIIQILPQGIPYLTSEIKSHNRGIKLKQTMVNKFKKELAIKEFYPNTKVKHLKNLRSRLLIKLGCFSDKSKMTFDALQELKRLVNYNFSKHFPATFSLLFHINGMTKLSRYENATIYIDIVKILKLLPFNKWLSIESFFDYLKYNNINSYPLDLRAAQSDLYYNIKHEHYKEKRWMGPSVYKKSIQEPFIKSVFFLFAAFGLVDIAFDNVEEVADEDRLSSPYDGLKAFKLNNLGAYILGLKDSYTPKNKVKKHEVKLSDKSLSIIVDPEDTFSINSLEVYAKRISNTRLMAHESHFLKGIKTYRELDTRLSVFKNLISGPIPDNWEHFFKTLSQKIKPVNLVSGYHLFKIPADNKDFMHLMIRDEQLNKLTLRAENMHFLVEQDNLGAFRKRLRELNYVLGI